MASLQVTCINKTNRTSPHERISNLGGSGWKYTEDQVINFIETRRNDFYVSVGWPHGHGDRRHQARTEIRQDRGGR